MSLTQALLDGASPQVMGDVRVQAAGRHAAVARSAGGVAKSLPSVDPIEDVVAATSEGERFLLVLGDGHEGSDAATTIVSALIWAFELGLPRRPLATDALAAAVTAANDHAWQAVRRLAYPRRGSRTTLAMAFGGPGWIQWASVGDSSVMLVRDGAATVLNTPAPVYLGGPLEPDHIRQLMEVQTFAAHDGDWLVVASDGYTDACSSLPNTASVFAEPIDAYNAAAQLVHQAVSAPANDHVAVGVGGVSLDGDRRLA